MSQVSTASRSKTSPKQQPDFWKQHSPHGECPLSFAGSLLMHLLFLAGIAVVSLGLFGLGFTGESRKPPEMDVVEIEGLGGGLGGTEFGSGKNKSGGPGRREGVESAKAASRQPLQKPVEDVQLENLPKAGVGLKPSPDDDPKVFHDDGVFAILEEQQARGKSILAKELIDLNAKGSDSGDGFKGGDKNGSQGGAGGPKGPGFGKGKGPSQGNSPTGKTLTAQRRHELRWYIAIGSPDGETHLKKLQALKVAVLLPMQNKPGFFLRYDLSKPLGNGEEVKFIYDPEKFTWLMKALDEQGRPNMINLHVIGELAKALRSPERPQYVVMILPPDLEADMARRELAYQGRQEWEIEKTIWDVRERDGVFDNEPSIVKQILRTGVR